MFEPTEEYAQYLSSEVLDIIINKFGLSADISYGVVDNFIRLNVTIHA